ncbi:MAG: phosphatase PAP2 family protein [Candidatus Woesearchaeota archaeon]|jgi:membrane-associated phospholipid phosphatase
MKSEKNNDWISKTWKKHKGAIFFILFIIQITFFYKLIQIFSSKGLIIKTALDDKIPFLSFFVIFYLSILIILFLPFILTFRNKITFLKLATTFFIISIMCNLTYVLFQTTIIRALVIPSTIFDKLVLFIYSIDNPFNSIPSMHVTFSVLSNLCLFNINKKVAYVILPFTILLILSTLFIKQHYIPGVLTGLVFAVLGYVLFKRMN